MSWNDDIKKIIELIPKLDAIYDELNKKREPEGKQNETEELKRKIDAIQSNVNPVADYDDSKIKAEIKSLGALLGELHDDVLRIKRAESSERTHNELISNFNERVLSLENQTNTNGDDEKQESINDIMELVKSQGRKIESIADQTVEIERLRMEIRNKDKEIAQCELHSKRAESLAKNCEELMQNIELKISKAGVNNGN